ncbi:urea transport system ATP-binding protein [Roseovarius lutimaris]|uniref:Urea transport system ATP-binding protein n=1 Tax=Roseovarius lutimaris TaxID=1005928 RepID=A0A1I5GVF4_9RHOB|nr:urea ABC transporter ATP-binding protein UrtD [Roseovarius lutimaris]SFO39863.1 urea transport system ATP-binding protein [Roseovarius lutimaris]
MTAVTDQKNPTPGAQAIQIDGLRVSFGDFVAIPHLTFIARYGEVHGVIGPNGAGKTTMMDVITGKTKPKKGTVRLDGSIDLLGLDEPTIALAGVGRKFQKPSVFEALSVRENLEIALRLKPRSILAELRNWSDRRRVARVGEVLNEIGLSAQADLSAGVLAHGQKQWLEIGMLLMQRPKLLMLDEPVAGMTDEETSHTADLVRRLRSPERAVLVIEHDMAFVEEIADRVTVLHEGNPIFEGRMEDARQDAQVRAVYLGR